jgi:hypothetical protein
LSTAPWHPEAPPQLQDALQVLITCNARCVIEAVSGLDIPAPAFAICVWPGEEPTELDPAEISLGLDTEREHLVSSLSPWAAWVEVWNPGGYRYTSIDFSDPSGDPAFRNAADQLLQWLEPQVLNPARWVLEEVAAQLTRDPPAIPVTDDFVTYAFAQAEELTASLRWIAPPDLQRKLEQKNLLVDEPRNLGGAQGYR